MGYLKMSKNSNKVWKEETGGQKCKRKKNEKKLLTNSKTYLS